MSNREPEIQSSIQHPIPQNIMSVEFKLIGDMTVKQFVYLASGIFVAYVVNGMGLPFFFRYPIAGTALVLGIGMAFFPIQDRGLDQWIKNFLVSAFSPQQMIWRKNPGAPIYFLADYAKQVKREMIAVTPDFGRNKVANFLNIVEKEDIDPLLSKERTFLKHLNSDVDSFEDYSLYEFPEDYATNKIISLDGVHKKEMAKEQERNFDMPEQAVVRTIPQDNTPTKHTQIDLDKQLKELKSLMDKLKNDFSKLHERTGKGRKEIGEDIKIKKDSKMIDRKLKAISLKTEDIDKLNKDNKLKDDIYSFRDEIKKLRFENKDLEKKLSQQKSLLKITEDGSNVTERYKQRIEELEADKLKMQDEIFNSSRVAGKGLDSQGTIEIKKEDNAKDAEFAINEIDQIKVKLTNTPNVINGTIKDTNDKLIIGAVVIVKDESGNSVRALKSNDLGQFVISTPLSNDTYNVQVVKQGYNFDIISVVLNGEVLSPILIKGSLV